MPLFVGLMSGTSADGVEAALVDIDAEQVRFRHACYNRFSSPLRDEIKALARGDYGERDPIDWLGSLDARLGEAFARVALQVIAETRVDARQVAAIGSHGQTIRHRPGGMAPFTLQIGDANLIAARTGITTVADFRRRDMALGGEGAPLAPAFHQAVFARPDTARAVLNLGGIANLTLLEPERPVRGFDTGPANTLLDAWASRHGRGRFDTDAALARAGRVNHALLKTMLADAYFERPPPKSSGPEHFNLDWLDRVLAKNPGLTAADVQATLVELATTTITRDLRALAPAVEQLYVCGGGVHNPALMDGLAHALPGVEVASTAALGVDPDYVEAMAFAWLAHRTLARRPGNLPAVTGAAKPAVLGAVYPAVN